MLVFKEVEEGFYRYQPNIARLRRVLPRILQILQECADHFGVELLKSEHRRPDLQSRSSELEQ
jgi:hypothetical protein